MATTTVNVNVAAAGTSGQVQFNDSGSFGADSAFHWDNTNKRLGVGATPASTVRLDVRAQGALSTDIAFRVRNSADTQNFLVVNGAGDVFNNGAGGVNTNTFFGENSGRSATGGNNSFFGQTAGQNNTTGIDNTFIGREAGLSNVSTGQNTFIGFGAGRSNIGSENTSIGMFSSYNKTTGDRNVFFGRDAGRRISGGGNLTIANNSVFLGFDTRAAADNQTNQIVIGHNAIGAGSNTVTLGNTSIILTILRGKVNMAGLPTSAAGLSAGDVWNNGGVLNIV